MLVKANMSRNRLYKVRMGLKEDLCLQSASMGDSSIWHTRLGHVNYKTMKSMISRELVIGISQISIEKEICGSCLLGKQARQVFPKATSYRATKVLELVHGDLCGPITPSTAGGKIYIFVLIDYHSRYMWSILLKDITPYEAFRRKRPNISHLRIFGCIGYAKVDKPHFKKLNDRSRILVHLGTEPESKAYHMLYPKTQKVIVSRDVVFDETKGWNWSEHLDEPNKA